MAGLETTLAQIFDSRQRGMHTALPGQIQSYDPEKQEADIVPLIHRTLPGPDDDDEDTVEELPVLMHVPVLFPRAGGFGITFPVQKGDTVLVIFCERAIGRWRATAERAAPELPELHGANGAVAIPGLYPGRDALEDVDPDNMVLGAIAGSGPKVKITPEHVEVDGTSDAAALASKVKAVIDAFVNAVPTATDGGAAIQAAVKAAWEGINSTVASSKLKLGG